MSQQRHTEPGPSRARSKPTCHLGNTPSNYGVTGPGRWQTVMHPGHDLEDRVLPDLEDDLLGTSVRLKVQQFQLVRVRPLRLLGRHSCKQLINRDFFKSTDT